MLAGSVLAAHSTACAPVQKTVNAAALSLQPLGLIHDGAPMADIRCHHGRLALHRTVRGITLRPHFDTHSGLTPDIA